MFKSKRFNYINPEPVGLVAHDQPAALTTEQFKMIRTHLDFGPGSGDWQTLVVTSATVGEGKSMVSANLAVEYAKTGARVLLIDANLRRPTVYQTFGVDNQRGLSTWLTKPAVALTQLLQVGPGKVSVLPSGPLPENPAELLVSPRLKALLTEAVAHFDRVIIDAPPLLPVTDGQVLAGIADATVLVVRNGISNRDNVGHAVQALADAHATLAGVVLDDVLPGRTRVYDGYHAQR